MALWLPMLFLESHKPPWRLAIVGKRACYYISRGESVVRVFWRDFLAASHYGNKLAGKGPVAANNVGEQSPAVTPRPRLRFAGDYLKVFAKTPTRVRRFKLYRIKTAAWVVLATTPLYASQFTFRHYQHEQGLSNLVVTGMAQDRTGFLWIGTENGAYRYDGRGFTRFTANEGLPSSRIYSLLTTRDGKTWVAGQKGLAYFDGDRFTPIRAAESLNVTGPGRMAEDSAGDIYVGTRSGLMRVSGSPSGYKVRRISSAPALGVTIGSDSAVWFGCDKDVCRSEGGTYMVLGSRFGLPADHWDSLALDANGTLWARSPKQLFSLARDSSRFKKRDENLPESFVPAAPITPDPVYGMLIPTERGLALPTGHGWTILGERQGLAADSVASAIRDRQGSLWIGFSGSGVDR